MILFLFLQIMNYSDTSCLAMTEKGLANDERYGLPR
jgi:hypothetical protein